MPTSAPGRTPAAAHTRFRPAVHPLEPRDIPAVDLTTAINNAPAAVPVGQNFTLSFTDTNAGPGATDRSWSTRIVVSADDTYGNADDSFLFSLGVGYAGFPAGGTYPVTYRMPGDNTRDLAPGRYRLFVAVDAYNDHRETNENNNLASVPIELTPPPDRDLTVTAVDAPAEFVTGQSFTVTATVANAGTVPTTERFNVGVYASADERYDSRDQFFGHAVVGATAIEAGASQNVTIIADEYYTRFVDPGKYFLIVRADISGDQAETDETNNASAAVPITGLPGPRADLVPSGLKAPAAARNGSRLNISWTVTNAGVRDAGARWDAVWLSRDQTVGGPDILVGEVFLPDGAPAGGSAEVSLSVTLDAGLGDYFLIVDVDHRPNVDESDDTNNRTAVPFRVTPGGPVTRGDLVPEVVIAPAEVSVGERMVVVYDVNNVGADIPAKSPGWLDALYLSADAALDDADERLFLEPRPDGIYTDGLPAGWGYQEVVTIGRGRTEGVEPGSYYLLLNAADLSGLGEHREDNNLTAVPLKVTGKPDLVSAVTAGPTAARIGEDFRATFTVANTGAGRSIDLRSDTLYLSADATWDAGDKLVASHTANNNGAVFKPGEAVEYNAVVYGSYTAGLASGEYYLIAKTTLNYYHQTEADEANNISPAFGPFPLRRPGVDLVVTDVTLDPAAVPVEGEVAVTYTVANHGADPTTAVTTVGLTDAVYLSADATFDPAADYLLGRTGPAEEVPSGGTYTRTVRGPLPRLHEFPYGAGTYYVLVVADEFDLQAEADEEHNVAAAELTVTAPDLTVTAATVPPVAVTAGPVAVTFTVANVGGAGTLNGTQASWYDAVVLSTDAVYDPETDTLLREYPKHRGGLEAGASYTVTTAPHMPFDLPPGEYFLFVVTDPTATTGPGDTGFAYESDEANNAAGPFALTVVENAPPVVDPIPNQEVNENETLTFTASAADPNAPYDRVTGYVLGGTPTGVDVDPATGVVTWTPTADQAGRAHDVYVGAGDTVPAYGYTRVSVRVYGRPTDISLFGSSVAENRPAGTGVGALSGTDPDNDIVSYSLVAGAADNDLFRIESDRLRTAGPFDFEARSAYSVVVRATDARGLTFDETFAVRVTDLLEVTGFEVQRGQAQRSFVRHLSVSLDNAATAPDLLAAGRLGLVRRDLEGNNPKAVPASAWAASVSGSTLALDFGSQGLGGNRNSSAGDGYYTLELDMDGDGVRETARSFYRLLGDTNGDRQVDASDVARVTAGLPPVAFAPELDLNGDGLVNATDVLLARRHVGRALAAGLPLDG